MLEPAHANLLKASVLPAVHVLADDGVKIGVGLPKQGHVALVARCGAQGVGVIATRRCVVLVRLKVPNHNVGVATAKKFRGQWTVARTRVDFWSGFKVDQAAKGGDGQASGREKSK